MSIRANESGDRCWESVHASFEVGSECVMYEPLSKKTTTVKVIATD